MTVFRIALMFLVSSLALSGPALSHGPTPQKAEETIAIKAAPADVWKAIKDFSVIADWHPGVTAADASGGNEPGATRTITLKSGGTLVEGLDEYNDKDMFYAYRLSKEDVAVFPVSFYSATIAVKAEGDGALVEWKGRFYRGDTGNFPPENLNDEAAVKAMQDFFKAGLEGIKAKVGAKS